MAYAREIILMILQYIRFRIPMNQEKNSYYTEIGSTLVRISNHCTRLRVWDDMLEKNPKWKGKPIISIVFEDNNSTYDPIDCLVLKRFRKKPIKVHEFVYRLNGDSHFLDTNDIQTIISSMRKIKDGKYIDKTRKCFSYQTRISQNPNRYSVDTNISDVDGSYQTANGWGADYVSESIYISNKYEKVNTKNVVKLTERDFHYLITEAVKQALNELYSNQNE